MSAVELTETLTSRFNFRNRGTQSHSAILSFLLANLAFVLLFGLPRTSDPANCSQLPQHHQLLGSSNVTSDLDQLLRLLLLQEGIMATSQLDNGPSRCTCHEHAKLLGYDPVLGADDKRLGRLDVRPSVLDDPIP
jgi:hypothetical protein